MIGELQFRRNRGKDDTGLATTLKIGAWSHLGQFADQRFANNGALLAAHQAVACLMHRGDYGITESSISNSIARKMATATAAASVFRRGSVSPSDRNRSVSTLTVELFSKAWCQIGQTTASARPSSTLVFRQCSCLRSGSDQLRTLSTPPPDEANLELTYAAQIVPGWIIQPVYTYLASEWHWRPSSRRTSRRLSLCHQILKRPPADGDVAGRVVQIGARMGGAGADQRTPN